MKRQMIEWVLCGMIVLFTISAIGVVLFFVYKLSLTL